MNEFSYFNKNHVANIKKLQIYSKINHLLNYDIDR